MQIFDENWTIVASKCTVTNFKLKLHSYPILILFLSVSVSVLFF